MPSVTRERPWAPGNCVSVIACRFGRHAHYVTRYVGSERIGEIGRGDRGSRDGKKTLTSAYLILQPEILNLSTADDSLKDIALATDALARYLSE